MFTFWFRLQSEFIIRKLMLMGLINTEDVGLCEAEFGVMDADGSGEITMSDLEGYLLEKEKTRLSL